MTVTDPLQLLINAYHLESISVHKTTLNQNLSSPAVKINTFTSRGLCPPDPLLRIPTSYPGASPCQTLNPLQQ